jgi:hypothetical protein
MYKVIAVGKKPEPSSTVIKTKSRRSDTKRSGFRHLRKEQGRNVYEFPDAIDKTNLNARNLAMFRLKKQLGDRDFLVDIQFTLCTFEESFEQLKTSRFPFLRDIVRQFRTVLGNSAYQFLFCGRIFARNHALKRAGTRLRSHQDKLVSENVPKRNTDRFKRLNAVFGRSMDTILYHGGLANYLTSHTLLTDCPVDKHGENVANGVIDVGGLRYPYLLNNASIVFENLDCRHEVDTIPEGHFRAGFVIQAWRMSKQEASQYRKSAKLPPIVVEGRRTVAKKHSEKTEEKPEYKRE